MDNLKQDLKNTLGIHNLGDCLDEAKFCITGERQDSYGSPEDSFALIAEYWETYINKIIADIYGSKLSVSTIPIDAKNVAHLMMLFKIARCSGQKPSRDNYVDICGYASIVADRLLR